MWLAAPAMKSWITRLARGIRMGVFRPEEEAAAVSLWNSEARASIPKPCPEAASRSRRLRVRGVNGCFDIMAGSVHKGELVEVQDDTAGIGQTVLLRVGNESPQF